MYKASKKSLKISSLLLVCVILFAGCGSSTLIRSIPDGAKIYVDGEPVGVTPYEHYDTKIVGSKTNIKLVLDGYEDLHARITRDEDIDVGALIGGCLLPPIPWLWIMKYKPQHTYEMVPLAPYEEISNSAEEVKPAVNVLDTKDTVKLLQLKDLLDRGVLTQDEFDAQKKKILEK